jgi:hypothetical protein
VIDHAQLELGPTDTVLRRIQTSVDLGAGALVRAGQVDIVRQSAVDEIAYAVPLHELLVQGGRLAPSRENGIVRIEADASRHADLVGEAP